MGEEIWDIIVSKTLPILKDSRPFNIPIKDIGEGGFLQTSTLKLRWGKK
jgi:hypothetical protein